MKKHPYFHFELKRQAKNGQGGVIIDFSHISPRTVVENISFFNKNLIFLDAGKNYHPPPPPLLPFPNEELTNLSHQIYKITSSFRFWFRR